MVFPLIGCNIWQFIHTHEESGSYKYGLIISILRLIVRIKKHHIRILNLIYSKLLLLLLHRKH